MLLWGDISCPLLVNRRERTTRPFLPRGLLISAGRLFLTLHGKCVEPCIQLESGELGPGPASATLFREMGSTPERGRTVGRRQAEVLSDKGCALLEDLGRVHILQGT